MFLLLIIARELYWLEKTSLIPNFHFERRHHPNTSHDSLSDVIIGGEYKMKIELIYP